MSAKPGTNLSLGVSSGRGRATSLRGEGLRPSAACSSRSAAPTLSAPMRTITLASPGCISPKAMRFATPTWLPCSTLSATASATCSASSMWASAT